MKSAFAAVILLAFATPALAQTAAPAAAPTTAQKAVAGAGVIADKVLGKAPAAAPAPAAKTALVNINAATPAQLDALPQIGVARTKAIIAGRPYKTVAELLDRKIIPQGAYDAIKDKVAIK